MRRDGSVLGLVWFGRGVVLAVMGVVLCGGGLDEAWGEEAAPGERLLSEALARMALDQLNVVSGGGGGAGGAVAGPVEGAIRASAVLLDKALALDPWAADLWALRAEAAQRLGDAEGRLAALRAYVRLRPADEVKKLALLRALIDQRGTLDERLMAVERLLVSNVGKRLSEPIRSRLALYASELAGELLQPEKRSRYLKEALDLDGANAGAARLLVEFVRSRGGGPRLVGAGLVGLVRAAPMDAAARLELAGVLAGEGLYGLAAEQFGVGQRLVGGPLPGEVYWRWMLSLGAAGQDAVLEQGMGELAALAGGGGAGGEADVLKLPAELQVIRLAALDGAEESAAREAALGAALSALDAEGEAASAAWIAVVFGGAELGAARVEALEGGGVEVDRARGLLAVERGDVAEAKALLEPIAGEDGLAAYGLARVSGLDEAGRGRALQAVVDAGPATTAGLLAARELLRMGREVTPTAVGRGLSEALRRVPPTVLRLDLAGVPWVDVRAEAVQRRLGYLDPVVLDVTVWNISPIPLEMGAGGTLSGLVAVTPRVTFGGRAYEGPDAELGRRLVIADLAQRVTLPQNGRYTARVRLGRYGLGQMLARRPEESFLVSLQAVTEPRVDGQGRSVPGLLGQTDFVQGMAVVGQRVGDVALAEWVASSEGEDVRVGMVAVARLARSGVVGSRAADAIGAYYEKSGGVGKAWVAAVLPSDGLATGELWRGLESAKEPLVRLVYLARQSGPGQEAVVSRLVRDPDERVRGLARAMRDAAKERAGEE
ncbi:MAG: hypothetical protein AAF750_01825 [Planctomycetota bacterium]